MKRPMQGEFPMIRVHRGVQSRGVGQAPGAGLASETAQCAAPVLPPVICYSLVCIEQAVACPIHLAHPSLEMPASAAEVSCCRSRHHGRRRATAWMMSTTLLGVRVKHNVCSIQATGVYNADGTSPT